MVFAVAVNTAHIGYDVKYVLRPYCSYNHTISPSVVAVLGALLKHNITIGLAATSQPVYIHCSVSVVINHCA
jgi:hypothetical protein